MNKLAIIGANGYEVDYMNEVRDLFIIGAGGFGREVAWLIERINENQQIWNLKGFIDDADSVQGTIQYGYPVVGKIDDLKSINDEVWVVCAVGSAKIRKNIINKLEKQRNLKFATLVDPSVIMSKSVHIGEGTIICAGTILTVDCNIGKHVIINLDCTIGHDDKIHDFVTVYPSVNISGNVEVEELVELGTGSQVIQGKYIKSDVIVGASAAVVKDILESGTYVGIPVVRKENKKLSGGGVRQNSYLLNSYFISPSFGRVFS
jgi:sugar O-acyltransferase (sialic acid O-acetyltransferase NeuD family)